MHDWPQFIYVCAVVQRDPTGRIHEVLDLGLVLEQRASAAAFSHSSAAFSAENRDGSTPSIPRASDVLMTPRSNAASVMVVCRLPRRLACVLTGSIFTLDLRSGFARSCALTMRSILSYSPCLAYPSVSSLSPIALQLTLNCLA